jgi:hypothetical protein
MHERTLTHASESLTPTGIERMFES